MVVLVILIVMAIAMAVCGNMLIIAAITGEIPFDWSEAGVAYILAIVADIFLLCLLLKKILPPVRGSFLLMRRGVKNRRIAKKASKKLKEYLRNEAPDLDRLQELRDKGISKSDTTRTLHFCQLIETLAGEEQLQGCLSEVREKQNVLDEIDDIENSIIRTAEKCKDAGDMAGCYYYLKIIRSVKKTPEVASLENEYEEKLFWMERERMAIWTWKKAAIMLLVILIAVFAVLYSRNFI